MAITPFDRHCWGYSKSGLDATAIATIMNANADEVAAAINAVEKWKATNSMEMVVASMNEQAMIAIEPVGRTLAEAQGAQRLVSPAVVNPINGELVRDAVYEPDHTTRIAATEAVARIVESVKERGPGVQVNVGGQHVHAGAGRSFEERLRLQREKRGIHDRSMDAVVTIDGGAAEMARDGSVGDEEELEEDFDDELEEDEDEDDGDGDEEEDED